MCTHHAMEYSHFECCCAILIGYRGVHAKWTIYNLLSCDKMVLHAPSDSSIPSPFSLSTFRLSLPYFHCLRWLDCMTQEVRSYTGDYTSGFYLQKTTRCSYFPFFSRLSSLSTVLWRLTDKVLLIFTFYIITHTLPSSLPSVHLMSPPSADHIPVHQQT